MDRTGKEQLSLSNVHELRVFVCKNTRRHQLCNMRTLLKMYPKSLKVSAIKYSPDIKDIKVINELLRQFSCPPPPARPLWMRSRALCKTHFHQI